MKKAVTPKAALIKKFTVIQDGNLHVLKVTKKDYNVLSFEKSNRPYGVNAPDKGKHSRHLGELMTQLGMCGLPTCVFESNVFKIADGQNRISDLMQNGKDVYFCLSQGTFQDTVIALNTSSKPLSKPDFIHLVATDGEGNKHYKVLEKVLLANRAVKAENKQLGVPDGLLISLYSGCKRADAKKIVAKKMFAIKDKATADKMVQYIYDIEKVGISKGLRPTEGFVNFVHEIEDFSAASYNHELFLRKLAASPELIKKINSEVNLKPIEAYYKEIYNKALLRKAS